MRFKGGRKKSSPDIRRLKLSRYLIPGSLPIPPVALDRTGKVPRPWQMFLNDVEGDCVVAAAGHQEMVLTCLGTTLRVLTDPDIQKAYEDVTGFDPSQTDANGNNPTDVGTDPATFCKYWRDTGLGLISIPQTPLKIQAWVQADATKQLELQLGVYLFGAMFLGFSLPDAVVTALEAGNVIPWVIPPGMESDPSWQPNPNNGHMVMSAKYDALGMYVVTWNEEVLVSWAVAAKCCDEPLVVLSSDIIGPNGKSPAGFDLPTMKLDLARITKQ